MKHIILIFLFFSSLLKAQYFVYEDINNNSTIQFVKSNHKKLFNKTDKSSLGATQSTIWLFIPLENNKNYSTYNYIRFRESFLHNIEVYDGNEVFKGGSTISFNQRKLPYVNDTFRILVPLNSTKSIYVKIVPKYNATYAYDIFDSKLKLLSHQNFFDNVFQSYTNIMSLIFISAFILFVIFRDRLFIYYALFVLTTILFQFFQTGRVLSYIYLRDIVKYDEIMALLTVFTLILFLTTLFKDSVQKSRFFKKLFKFVFVSLIFGIFVLLINFNFYIDLLIEVLILNIGLFSALLFVYYLVVNRVKYSVFILFGMCILIISSLFCALYYIGVIDNPYSLVLIQISSVIESLAFLSLILYRIYNKLSLEKQKSDKYASTLNDMQRLAKMGTWVEYINDKKISIDKPTKEIIQIYEDEISLEELYKLIHPEDLEEFLNLRNKINQNKTINSIEYRIITPLGKLKYVSIHWQYIYDKNGQLSHLEGYIVDITEKYLVQKEIEEQQALLTHQQKLAQQGEMINMIAHQWRQPLAAITATVNNLELKNLIGKKLSPQELTSELKLITDYAQHLSSTIEDFRNFFKPNKDKELITLESLLDKSISIIKTSIESHNITLIRKEQCGKSILTYSNEIQQVILNIIKNAQDALVNSDIKEKKIFIETSCDKDFVILSICDNAGGIDEHIINRIFEPYFSTKSKQEGTGLGLYMSRIIINEHCNGSISVENTKDGAKFIIKLPLFS